MESNKGKDTKEAKKGNNRLAHLREIETQLQKEWEDNKVYEAKAKENWQDTEDLETKNKEKFFVTFPYPYMNGRLHLGHAFSVSKCEFQSRYQRLIGKNVLFPFGFHCTGMPIAAAAKRIQKELKEGGENKKQGGAPTQTQILEQVGVPKEEIPQFADPLHWLDYFPPRGKEDLEKFGLGVDFSRSFITTEKQPFYDKFVQWHFLKLQKAGKVKFGKRNAIFSRSDDQPCADHDRSEGEGLGPQEYTLIKMKLVDNIPEKLNQYKDKNVFLVAATLRPETMYGQTNCYILPNGEYGLYEMKNGDLFICSEHSAINMAYQEMTKENKVAVPLLKIKGKELIGAKISAPLSVYKEVYLFPMETISMTKGTGVVTSVPSDSPDDWINLHEFKTDAKLREKWGIKEEMIFEPIHIIKLKGFGDLPAKEAVEKYGVKNSKDKAKLAEAKEEVYTKGFYSGIMDFGPYKGQAIQEAKNKVKNDLIKEGLALTYFEPEGIIKNRQGETCVVALVDQWYLVYGEEEWKNFVLKHIHSENFNAYSQSTLKAINDKVCWLKEWGCSRTFGLGSHIPWDKQYLIESLSDSTIYMAYYTIANFLHEDIFGTKHKNGIEPEMLTEEVFDYIFLGKELDFSKTKIPEKVLKEMRNSFTYWYPMNLRCSGKDLIGNHLTMSLYNHAAVWNDEKMMTRGYFCNGYILVNNQKMSKSKGNFLTIHDLVSRYGCDASRIALADCGDGLDDANFVTELADLSINRLYSFENFVKILINETWAKNSSFAITDPEGKIDFNGHFDQMFDNNINYLIEQAKEAYERMKYKDVLKYAFYEMINSKDEYILFNGDDYNKLNPTLMVRFLKTFFVMIEPIIPHWTEYMYRTYLNPIFEKFKLDKYKITFLSKATFPVISNPIDKKLFFYNRYINKVVESVRDLVNKKDKKGGKKGKNQKEEKKEEPKEVKVSILFAKEYTPNQKKVFEILRKQKYDDFNKIVDEEEDKKKGPKYKQEIMEYMKGKDNKERSAMLEFASFTQKEIESYGMDALKEEMLFNEEEALKTNLETIKSLTKVNNIEIVEYQDSLKPKTAREPAMPGKPLFVQA